MTAGEEKRNVMKLSGGQQRVAIARALNKCVIVVTHSNELAAQADVVLRLKRGSLHPA